MNIFDILAYAKGITGLANGAEFLRRKCVESGFPFTVETRIREVMDDNTFLRLRVVDRKSGEASEWKVFFSVEKIPK